VKNGLLPAKQQTGTIRSKMSDRIITFVCTTAIDLTFDEWFDKREEMYESKEDALKIWNAMCDATKDDDVFVEPNYDFGWDDISEDVAELEGDAKEAEDMVMCLHCFINLYPDGDTTIAVPGGYICQTCMDDDEDSEGEGDECEGCGVRESKECKSDCSYQAKREEEENDE